MAAVVPVVSKPSNEQSVLHDSQVPKMIGLHGRCIKLHHIELDLNIYNRYKYIYIYKNTKANPSQFTSLVRFVIYTQSDQHISETCVCVLKKHFYLSVVEPPNHMHSANYGPFSGSCSHGPSIFRS